MRKQQDKTKTQVSERGAALVVSILALLLITVLSIALLGSSMVSQNVTHNSIEQTEAYFISEAGLTHASNLIKRASLAEFNAILQAGDGVAGTGDELSTRPTGLTPIPMAGLAFGTGTYRAFVLDDPAETDGNPNADSNGRLLVRAIGTGRNGSSATTESIFAFSTTPAILINGPLQINGNPPIGGAWGAVHANGPVTISGNPCVSQYIASTSTITVGGSVLGGGCVGVGVTRPFQPIIEPPLWNIPDFRSRADYVLGSTGIITTGAGTFVHNAVTNGTWNIPGGGTWSWGGNQKWVHGGSALPPNKTWYAVGNMEIGDSFGTAASPVTATFIAEGYIVVSGNPYTRRYLDNIYAFMAGTDLEIGGNPAAGSYGSAGIHYANHQIKFNGAPRINGVVIGRNTADVNSPGCGCNPVPYVSGNITGISGDAVVNYDGGLLSNQARLVSWREVRN